MITTTTKFSEILQVESEENKIYANLIIYEDRLNKTIKS